MRLLWTLVIAGLLAAPAFGSDGASCTLPGELVSEDATGDAADPAAGAVPDPLAQHDVQGVYVAEPPGSDRIYFSIKVASLDPIPPQSQYYVRFVLSDGLEYFVAFDPYAPPGEDAYTLGRRDPPATPGTSGSLTTIGPADEGTNSADGFVTWGIRKDRLGLEEGGTLESVFGQARVSLVAVVSSVDESPQGYYALNGGAGCSGVKQGSGALVTGAVPAATLLLLGLAALGRRRR
ncbi:MAG TPA: hypothetical protein VM369_00645 [Candidatus Binatia bacterium]|nr:hypothetical protein [Candidatus Binatia bacterium]